MFKLIPFIGDWLTTFLWGGAVVNDCTLKRFFILHFLLPFILLAFIILHIHVIHKTESTGNTQALFQTSKAGDITYKTLYPLYFIKDLIIIL
jgi:ubiquinol-cytochrome c reductase cytochrome b subunit